MSWNYRVIKRKYEMSYGNVYEWAIYEVYYDADGNPDGVTVDPVFPRGDTREELGEAFMLYMKAFEKPVLDYGDFEYKEYRLRDNIE